MDEDKLRFLFGTVPDRVDESDVLDLLLADREGDEPGSSRAWVLRVALALRLLRTDTGWADVARRLADGEDRHAVLEALVEQHLPLFDEADQVMTAVVRARGVVDGEALSDEVCRGVGLDPTDPVAASVISVVLDDQLADVLSPLAPVVGPGGPSVVDVPTLLAGQTFTHHLTAAERADQHVDLEPDLAPLARLPEPRVAAGPLHVDDGAPRWGGPAGWLPDVPADGLLAVRADASGLVEVWAADGAPEAPAELVDLVRAAYDATHATSGLPVASDELLLGVLARDATAFATLRPPLVELAAAAGLEVRDGWFGTDDAVFAAGAAAARRARLEVELVEPELVDAAEAALDVLGAEQRDPAALRRTLDVLGDPPLLLPVIDELLDPDDGSRLAEVGALADHLVTVAGGAVRGAVAHYLAAAVAERAARPGDAESHLRAAAALVEGWTLVEDQLAWYAADRGHAADAIAHWRAAGMAETPLVDFVVEQAAASSGGPTPGRNEPCWCGSGRKTKQCHRDAPPLPPLAERLNWLLVKPTMYLERRGGALNADIDDYAHVLAGDEIAIEEAAADPLIVDVLLAEGGWLGRFVAERGSLLPADEAELVASWAATPRAIYEVVGISYGRGLTLRRLSDGAELLVADRVIAAAVKQRELICAVVGSDGAQGYRFVSGVARVPRGLEDELADLLDHGDPLDVLDWLADAESLTYD